MMTTAKMVGLKDFLSLLGPGRYLPLITEIPSNDMNLSLVTNKVTELFLKLELVFKRLGLKKLISSESFYWLFVIKTMKGFGEEEGSNGGQLVFELKISYSNSFYQSRLSLKILTTL